MMKKYEMSSNFFDFLVLSCCFRMSFGYVCLHMIMFVEQSSNHKVMIFETKQLIAKFLQSRGKGKRKKKLALDIK